MSHFKAFKIAAFGLILGAVMSECFEPSNIIRVVELNFEPSKSTKRWRRVKEYFHQVEDDHWQRNLKDAKRASEYRAVWDSEIYPYPKMWPYGHPKAKFSAKIFKDAQKPKKSQRSNLLKRRGETV